MSRKTLVTLLLIIVSALLAVALFIAGAIWRGRMTAQAAVTNSRKITTTRQTRYINQGRSREASGSAPGESACRRTGRPCHFADCA